jgi:hypothetical protein
MTTWPDAVAAEVCARILEANRGRWPASVREWRRVAHAHDHRLRLDPETPFPGIRMDGMIVLRETPEATLLARCAHEVSHAVLAAEQWPVVTPATSTQVVRHEISTQVEGAYVEWLGSRAEVTA